MKISDIKLIQKFLKSEGLYKGKIDGISKALEERVNKLPEQWISWSVKRKSIAYLQLLCQENSIDSGQIDGCKSLQLST